MSTQTSNGVLAEEEPLRKEHDVDSARKVPPTDEGRRARVERRLRERTGLSRTGLLTATVIVVLLFVSLVVVVALAACWPRTPHKWQFPVCKTTQCLEASAKIVGMMNASRDPCSDFWGFSCGSWLDKHRTLAPERSAWSAGLEDAFHYSERLRSLITTLPHTNDIASISWKIKTIFKSCMDVEYIDTDKDRPLKSVIRELGNWHVLREFSVYSWDYKRTLEQLHSQHGVSAFFQIRVVPDSRLPADPTQPRQNVIQISPAGLGFPDKSYYLRHPDSPLISGYKRYLKDAVQVLGATSVDANLFSAAIYHFEKRIAEVTPDADELADPIRSYNPKTLAELQIIAPSIPLHEILIAKYPKAKIDDATKIIVTSPSYLGNISLIISAIDRSGLNNYLMWQLTRTYLPYLSQDYQDIVNYYRKEITGVSRDVSRWEFCVSTTRRFMSFGLASLEERLLTDRTRDRASDVANSMFETIRSSVELAIKSADFLDQDVKHQAMDKIISLGLQVGLPTDLASDGYLTAFYSLLPVKRSDLFTNIGYGVGFLQDHESKQLTGQTHDSWLDKMAAGDEVFYSAAEHKVAVPMWLAVTAQQSPASLYGTLGIALSRAIASSVHLPDLLYKPRGDLLPVDEPAVTQAEHLHARAKACLMRDATQHLTNRTAGDAIVQIAAVRHAAKALAASKYPHVHQPALESLDDEALFYIVYAQSLCAVSTPEQRDIDQTVDTRAAGLPMLQASLRQLSNFAEVFACPSDSPYVSQPCEDIL